MPDLGNSLDSLLNTIESACVDSGQAPSTCTCLTDRLRNAEADSQSLDKLASKLQQIMRDCLQQH